MDQSSGLRFYHSLLPMPNLTLQQNLILYAITLIEIGEGRLDYPIQDRHRILTDVIQLLFHMPSLVPKRGRFQKGEPLVLVITGTIPIFYKAQHYKTPIKIWVPLGYPRDSPKVRVVVEDQAILSIKFPHPYVDAGAGGLVNVPYMQAWTESHLEIRTLTDLVINMCECFSVDPPVRQRVPPKPPAPVPTFPIPQPPQEQEMQERERQEEGKRFRGKRGRGWACGLL